MTLLAPPKDIDIWQEMAGDSGGDLVMIERRPDVVRLIVVDASGHGPKAAAIAAEFAAIARPALRRPLTAATFTDWNRMLSARLPACAFVALTATEWYLDTGELRLWNAGNPAPKLLTNSDSRIASIDSFGMPVGIIPPDLYQAPKCVQLSFSEFRSLVLTTDGLADQWDSDGRFGDQRITAGIARAAARGTTIIEELKSALSSFTPNSRESDDLTVVDVRPSMLREIQSHYTDSAAA
jgi:serine phosphatase RsbU (regulator of sigma subunit)